MTQDEIMRLHDDATAAQAVLDEAYRQNDMANLDRARARANETRAALAAAVGRLAAERDEYAQTVTHMLKVRDGWIARAEKAERDAARYRYLRGCSADWYGAISDCTGTYPENEEHADALLDVAIMNRKP